MVRSNRSATARCRRAWRNDASSSPDSAVSGTGTSMTAAISGSHGSNSGASRVTRATNAAACSLRFSSCRMPSTARRSWRNAKYAVEESYCSQTASKQATPAARCRSSAIRRDFPTPESPDTATSRVPVSPMSRKASVSSSSSRPRPTNGRCSRSRRPRVPRIEPTLNAVTGFALPLSESGGSSVDSKSVRDRSRTSAVVRISPECAFAIRRAARFTASPMTV